VRIEREGEALRAAAIASDDRVRLMPMIGKDDEDILLR